MVKAGKILLLGTGVALCSYLVLPMVKARKAIARFAGYSTELIQGQTTTRQSDGETAYDFRNFPLIDVTGDIDGDYEARWSWTGYVDGVRTGSGSGIVNTLPNVVGGQTKRFKLIDSRPGNVRGGSLARGDPDGNFDGLWHTIRWEVSVTVISPSGAQDSCSGVIQETYKTVGALSAAWAGYNTQLI